MMHGMTRSASALLGAAALGVLLAMAPAPQPASWALTVEPLPTPTAARSGQPQLSVSNRGVILSWIERTGDTATLKFAETTPTGWSEPQTVASGRDWFVNWADVPSVARLKDGTLVAHWL